MDPGNEVWPSIVALSLINHVERTTLETKALKSISISRAPKLKATNSLYGPSESSGRVGVDAGTPTLLLIRFHLIYMLNVLCINF